MFLYSVEKIQKSIFNQVGIKQDADGKKDSAVIFQRPVRQIL